MQLQKSDLSSLERADEHRVENDFSRFGIQKAWDDLLALPTSERQKIMQDMQNLPKDQKILNSTLIVDKWNGRVPFSGYEEIKSFNSPRQLKDYRQQLDTEEERQTLKEAAPEFREDIDSFVAKARQENISEEEISNTLAQSTRLISDVPDAVLPKPERMELLRGMFTLLQSPDAIPQGMHDTCDVTSIQSIVAAKDPSSIAHLLADVALTGTFTTASGKAIKMSPATMQRDLEANGMGFYFDDRSYSSQIFQNIAEDIYFQSDVFQSQYGLEQCNFGGKGGTAGFIEQSTNKIQGKTADHLVCNKDGKTVEPYSGLPNARVTVVAPPFANGFIASEITAKPQPLSEINLPAVYKNEADFEASLEERSRIPDGKGFPIAFGVRADGRRHGPAKAGHSITVNSYDPKTKIVRYSVHGMDVVDELEVNAKDLFKTVLQYN
jgi:hypothetical protein